MVAPYNLCNNGTTSLVSSVAATVGTTGTGTLQGASTGDLIVVICGNLGSSGLTISTPTDSQGNTYSLITSKNVAASPCAAMYACLTAAPLVSGTDVITGHWASTAGAGKMMIVKGCPGVSSATADKGITASGTSTAPSSGSSGVLAQASEVVFGGLYNNSGGGTPTSPSFGSILSVTDGGVLSEIDEVVSSTAAVTASATISASTAWIAMLASFGLAPPALPPSPALVVPQAAVMQAVTW